MTQLTVETAEQVWRIAESPNDTESNGYYIAYVIILALTFFDE